MKMNKLAHMLISMICVLMSSSAYSGSGVDLVNTSERTRLIGFDRGFLAFQPQNIQEFDSEYTFAKSVKRCNLSSEGDVYCAFEPNPMEKSKSLQFKKHPAFKKAIQIAETNYHICAIQSDSTVVCIENKLDKEFSHGDFGTQAPEQIKDAEGARSIYSYWAEICVVKTAGAVFCWGYPLAEAVNKALSGLTGVIQVGLNQFFGCVLTEDAKVLCWTHKELVPRAISGLAPVKKISIGDTFACALEQSGHVKCWGGNQYGELADHTRVDSGIPVPIDGVYKAKDLTSRLVNSCALLESGQLACWGGRSRNLDGAKLVKGLTNVASLIDGNPDCVILVGGKVVCDKKTPEGFLMCQHGPPIHVDPFTLLKLNYSMKFPKQDMGDSGLEEVGKKGKPGDAAELYLIAAGRYLKDQGKSSEYFSKALEFAIVSKNFSTVEQATKLWLENGSIEKNHLSNLRGYLNSIKRRRWKALADLYRLIGIKHLDQESIEAAEKIYRALGNHKTLYSFYREVYQNNFNPDLKSKFLLKTIHRTFGSKEFGTDIDTYKECFLLESRDQGECGYKLAKECIRLGKRDLARFYLSKVISLSGSSLVVYGLRESALRTLSSLEQPIRY